jgi:hypothetical protein
LPSFIIEQDGIIREAFSYRRSINEDTRHALNEYARATYGATAFLRNMTTLEEAEFNLHGPERFETPIQA